MYLGYSCVSGIEFDRYIDISRDVGTSREKLGDEIYRNLDVVIFEFRR